MESDPESYACTSHTMSTVQQVQCHGKTERLADHLVVRRPTPSKNISIGSYKGHPYIPKTKILNLFVFCMNDMCVYECKLMP